MEKRIQQSVKMALLSPAGSRESLIAAVQNGADAVYLGGSAFNARRFAGNFSDEELLWAIEYCHARGVSVNVTFNTLLFDKELPAALSYGRFLYEAGADAAIVQDLGLVHLLREICRDSCCMRAHKWESVIWTAPESRMTWGCPESCLHARCLLMR